MGVLVNLAVQTIMTPIPLVVYLFIYVFIYYFFTVVYKPAKSELHFS